MATMESEFFIMRSGEEDSNRSKFFALWLAPIVCFAVSGALLLWSWLR